MASYCLKNTPFAHLYLNKHQVSTIRECEVRHDSFCYLTQLTKLLKSLHMFFLTAHNKINLDRDKSEF